MSVLHSLHCLCCEWEGSDFVSPPDFPPCPECQGPTTWTPAGFTTDVFGAPKYSDAAHRTFSSQREKESYMRTQGYEVAGDKVRGARPELSIRGSGFSYVGQGKRRTHGE
jgi:hypothetical protein